MSDNGIFSLASSATAVSGTNGVSDSPSPSYTNGTNAENASPQLQEGSQTSSISSIVKKRPYYKDWRVYYSYNVRDRGVVEGEHTVYAISPIAAMRETLQVLKDKFDEGAFIDSITVTFDADRSGMKFRTPKKRDSKTEEKPA